MPLGPKGTTVRERQTVLTRNKPISLNIIPVVHLHKMGILRARVRRAIVGRIPFSTRAT